MTHNQGIQIAKERTGVERYNTQGVLMKVVRYNSNNDLIIEFQDEYKLKNIQIGLLL